MPAKSPFNAVGGFDRTGSEAVSSRPHFASNGMLILRYLIRGIFLFLVVEFVLAFVGSFSSHLPEVQNLSFELNLTVFTGVID